MTYIKLSGRHTSSALMGHACPNWEAGGGSAVCERSWTALVLLRPSTVCTSHCHLTWTGRAWISTCQSATAFALAPLTCPSPSPPPRQSLSSPSPPQLSPSLRPVTRLADRQPILDRTILSMPTKRPWSGLIELPTLIHRSSSGRHTLSQLFTSRRSGPASGGRSHSSSSPVYLVRAPAPIRCCFMSMSSIATSPADNIRRPLPRRPGARPACEDPDTTLAR